MSDSIIIVTNLLKGAFYVADLTGNLYHNTSLIVICWSGQVKLYKKTFEDYFWRVENSYKLEIMVVLILGIIYSIL